MLSVRREWTEAKTEADKLKWADKWGDLLMETYQNPMWTAGHTQATKEFLAILRNIKAGNKPEVALPQEILDYAEALHMVTSDLKVVSFKITAQNDMLHKLDEAVFRKVAIDQMAAALMPYLYIEENELENGDVEFTYNLTMVT